MSQFKVGDRVVCIKESYKRTLVGETGTIRVINAGLPPIGVEWDENVNGHDGNGHFVCKHGHGWFVNNDAIKLNSRTTIVITTNGKTTTATLREGKTVVKTATAICHHDDENNFAVGAQLAYNRLMYGMDKLPAEVAAEEAKPQYYNGKVICVEKKNEFLTAGRVYRFEDGFSIDDNGDQLPGLTAARSIAELNEIMWSKFIEYKGGLE